MAIRAALVVFWCKDPLRQISVQLQSTPFFRGLTVSENLTLFANFHGVHLSKQQVTELLKRCGFTEVARTEASRLSGANKNEWL
jgi:ABC-2 type transport system ATP-binding protein